MIQFNVSAVPERMGHARAIAKATGGVIHLDKPKSGTSWTNYRKALLRGGGDWIVSVDDDAILCPGFVDNMHRALKVCPGDVACFYSNDGAVVNAGKRFDASWLGTTRKLWGICWAIKSKHAQDIVDLVDRMIRPDYHSGDQRLLFWALMRRFPVWVSLPSLVKHRTDIPSSLSPDSRLKPCITETAGVDTEWSAKTCSEPLCFDGVLDGFRKRRALL